jgi:hypothetical protein
VVLSQDSKIRFLLGESPGPNIAPICIAFQCQLARLWQWVRALIINNKVPPPSEPRAEQRPFVRNLHGIRLTDEYAWLKAPNWREVMRDPQQLDPAIRAYLQAENGYCERLPKQATQEIKRHQSSRSIASDPIKHTSRGVQIPIAPAAPPYLPPSRFPPLEAFGHRPPVHAAPLPTAGIRNASQEAT